MTPDPRSDDEAGHIVMERPPPGLARGHYPAPAWVVWALAVAVVLGACAYLALRLRGKNARR